MDFIFDDRRKLMILINVIGTNTLFQSQIDLVTSIKELRNEKEIDSPIYLEYTVNDDFDSVNNEEKKAINMVIGIINYPDFHTLDTNALLSSFMSEFDLIPVKKIYIFNYEYQKPLFTLPSSNQQTISTIPISSLSSSSSSSTNNKSNRLISQDHDDVLIVIPTECSGNYSGDINKKTIAHLRLMISLSIQRVFKFITMKIQSISRDEEIRNMSLSEATVGDYYLLLGNYLDALEYYSQSIEYIRKYDPKSTTTTTTTKDHTHVSSHHRHAHSKISQSSGMSSSTLKRQILASRLDSIAKTCVLLLKHGYGTTLDVQSKDPMKYIDSIIQRCSLDTSSDMSLTTVSRGNSGSSIDSWTNNNSDDVASLHYFKYEENSIEKKLCYLLTAALYEALTIHSQPPVRPAAEARCALKMAAYMVDVYVGPSETTWLHPFIIQKIWDYVLRASSVEGLSAPQQVTCLVIGSQLCETAGLVRKAGLLLYMASLLCVERGSTEMAKSCIQSACHIYQLRNMSKKKNTPLRQSIPAWIHMKRSIHSTASYIYRQNSDYEMAISHVSDLMQILIACEQWNEKYIYSYVQQYSKYLQQYKNVKIQYPEITDIQATNTRKSLLDQLTDFINPVGPIVPTDPSGVHVGRASTMTTQIRSSTSSYQIPDQESLNYTEPVNMKTPMKNTAYTTGFLQPANMYASKSHINTRMYQSTSSTGPTYVTLQDSTDYFKPPPITPHIRNSTTATPNITTGTGVQDKFNPISVRKSQISLEKMSSSKANVITSSLNDFQQKMQQGLMKGISRPSIDSMTSSSQLIPLPRDTDTMTVTSTTNSISERFIKYTSSRRIDGHHSHSSHDNLTAFSTHHSSEKSTTSSVHHRPPLEELPHLSERSDVSHNPLMITSFNRSHGNSYVHAQQWIDALKQVVTVWCTTLEYQNESITLLKSLCSHIAPFHSSSIMTSSPSTVWKLPIPPFAMTAETLIPTDQKLSKSHMKILNRSIQALQQAAAGIKTMEENATATTATNTISSGGGGGALFYDPFAADRAKTSDIQNECAIWCIGHTCTITITISNPLHIPLYFTNIQPILTGIENTDYRLMDQSIVLPPNSTKNTIQLHVYPLKHGIYQLEGIQLFLHNIKFNVYVDEDGYHRDYTLPKSWIPYEIDPAVKLRIAQKKDLHTVPIHMKLNITTIYVISKSVFFTPRVYVTPVQYPLSVWKNLSSLRWDTDKYDRVLQLPFDLYKQEKRHLRIQFECIQNTVTLPTTNNNTVVTFPVDQVRHEGAPAVASLQIMTKSDFLSTLADWQIIALLTVKGNTHTQTLVPYSKVLSCLKSNTTLKPHIVNCCVFTKLAAPSISSTVTVESALSQFSHDGFEIEVDIGYVDKYESCHIILEYMTQHDYQRYADVITQESTGSQDIQLLYTHRSEVRLNINTVDNSPNAICVLLEAVTLHHQPISPPSLFSLHLYSDSDNNKDKHIINSNTNSLLPPSVLFSYKKCIQNIHSTTATSSWIHLQNQPFLAFHFSVSPTHSSTSTCGLIIPYQLSSLSNSDTKSSLILIDKSLNKYTWKYSNDTYVESDLFVSLCQQIRWVHCNATDSHSRGKNGSENCTSSTDISDIDEDIIKNKYRNGSIILQDDLHKYLPIIYKKYSYHRMIYDISKHIQVKWDPNIYDKHITQTYINHDNYTYESHRLYTFQLHVIVDISEIETIRSTTYNTHDNMNTLVLTVYVYITDNTLTILPSDRYMIQGSLTKTIPLSALYSSTQPPHNSSTTDDTHHSNIVPSSTSISHTLSLCFPYTGIYHLHSLYTISQRIQMTSYRLEEDHENQDRNMSNHTINNLEKGDVGNTGNGDNQEIFWKDGDSLKVCVDNAWE